MYIYIYTYYAFYNCILYEYKLHMKIERDILYHFPPRKRRPEESGRVQPSMRSDYNLKDLPEESFQAGRFYVTGSLGLDFIPFDFFRLAAVVVAACSNLLLWIALESKEKTSGSAHASSVSGLMQRPTS